MPCGSSPDRFRIGDLLQDPVDIDAHCAGLRPPTSEGPHQAHHATFDRFAGMTPAMPRLFVAAACLEDS